VAYRDYDFARPDYQITGDADMAPKPEKFTNSTATRRAPPSRSAGANRARNRSATIGAVDNIFANRNVIIKSGRDVIIDGMHHVYINTQDVSGMAPKVDVAAKGGAGKLRGRTIGAVRALFGQNNMVAPKLDMERLTILYRPPTPREVHIAGMPGTSTEPMIASRVGQERLLVGRGHEAEDLGWRDPVLHRRRFQDPQSMTKLPLRKRTDFFDVLDETRREADARAQRARGFEPLRSIAVPLEAMQNMTAGGRPPTEDERDSTAIGLIAVREREPTEDAQMADFNARLYELEGYFREWPADAS
jgi:hypothetical protein